MVYFMVSFRVFEKNRSFRALEGDSTAPQVTKVSDQGTCDATLAICVV